MQGCSQNDCASKEKSVCKRYDVARPTMIKFEAEHTSPYRLPVEMFWLPLPCVRPFSQLRKLNSMAASGVAEAAAASAGRQRHRFTKLSQVTSSLMPMLFRSPGFVVIDKPFDLRMDPDRNDAESAVASVRQGLAALYDIHEPRWIHRLDYATSGVVAVGRTRAGSAPVAPLFEQRLTSKLYLAVVEGHVGSTPPPVAEACMPLLTCLPMLEHQRLLREGPVDGPLRLKHLESNVLLKPPMPAAAPTPTASAADALDTPVVTAMSPIWVSVDGLQTPPPRQSAGDASAQEADGASTGSPHAGGTTVKGGFIINGPIADGEEGSFTMRIAGKELGGRVSSALTRPLCCSATTDSSLYRQHKHMYRWCSGGTWRGSL